MTKRIFPRDLRLETFNLTSYQFQSDTILLSGDTEIQSTTLVVHNHHLWLHIHRSNLLQSFHNQLFFNYLYTKIRKLIRNEEAIQQHPKHTTPPTLFSKKAFLSFLCKKKKPHLIHQTGLLEEEVTSISSLHMLPQESLPILASHPE